MKAIKIASGVAVTALAAAISAQVHAEDEMAPEFSWSATGSMEAVYTVNLAGTDANGDDAAVMDVDLDEEDDFDSATAGEAWGLEVTNTVVYGPFSGNIVFTADDASGEDNTAVSIEDLIVTDGAISFGQVGSLLTTDDYTYDMGDSTTVIAGLDADSDGNDDDIELDDGAPIDAGIRYTMGDLQVQVEGQNDDAAPYGTDYGVSAAYAGSMDALSYVADLQVRVSDQAPDSADPYTYVGAGVSYATDMFSVAAAYNTYTSSTTAAQVAPNGGTGEKETFAEYGFEVEVTPIAAMTAYVKGQDLDASSVSVDDSMELLFGATYTIDMITVKGEYTYTAAEEAGDEILANVTYTDGPLSGYGEVTLANFDAETANAPLFEAGVSYTQDNGVKYAADYDFRSEETDALADNQAEINMVKLSAAYAF